MAENMGALTAVSGEVNLDRPGPIGTGQYDPKLFIDKAMARQILVDRDVCQATRPCPINALCMKFLIVMCCYLFFSLNAMS